MARIHYMELKDGMLVCLNHRKYSVWNPLHGVESLVFCDIVNGYLGENPLHGVERYGLFLCCHTILLIRIHYMELKVKLLPEHESLQRNGLSNPLHGVERWQSHHHTRSWYWESITWS